MVTDLPLATGHGDVDEAAGVSEPLLRAALGGLLLLLGLNLLSDVSASILIVHFEFGVDGDMSLQRWIYRCDRMCSCLGGACAYLGYRLLASVSHDSDDLALTGLRLDLSGTSERSVNLTHDCG